MKKEFILTRMCVTMKWIGLTLVTILFSQFSVAQNSLVLNEANSGGMFDNYFDLGDKGFVLAFTKGGKQGVRNSDGSKAYDLQFFSKDLSRRIRFKATAIGQMQVYANSKNLLVLDRIGAQFMARLFDLNGMEIAAKKFDLAGIGLTRDLVSSTCFTSNGRLLFVVYDNQNELHLFSINIANPREISPAEIDLMLPGSDPLSKYAVKGTWQFLTGTMGYVILTRKGSSSINDPASMAYHIALFDEDFSLIRELLLDNFLQPGTRVKGNTATLQLNPEKQSFQTACLAIQGGILKVVTGDFSMHPNSNQLMTNWYKEYNLIDNGRYQFVSNENQTDIPPPSITSRGAQTVVSVRKTRPNPGEEVLNQLLLLDAQGTALLNSVQTGDFNQLSLDGYCDDNQNLYSRFRGLKMETKLRSFCDNPKVDVLDLDIDDKGNELLITHDKSDLDQILIYRFTGLEKH